jgi:alpha-glucosidase
VQRTLSICLGLSFLTSLTSGATAAVVQSPDGQIRAEVSVNASGRVQYQILRQGQTVIQPSDLGLIMDGADLGSNVSLGEPTGSEKKETYRWRGSHVTATNFYRGLLIPATHQPSQTAYAIELRAFDMGMGFRYSVPGKGRHVVSGEKTSFVLPPESEIWLQTNTSNYEGIYEKRRLDQVHAVTNIGPPLTVVLPDGRGYAAISEAALFGYSGMTLRPVQEAPRAFEAQFEDDHQWELNAPFTTPWRVVLVSPDLNGLVNADVIPNLCPPPGPELRDAAWIRPGRAAWSWWSQGTGDFYRNKLYVDYAHELGWEFNLVDAGWENWKEGDRGKWELVRELVEFGRSRSVGIWVWKHVSGVKERAARRQFFDECHQAGVVGIKIDFMDSEAKQMINFYEQALRDAAEFHLMINFHGANKPTGEARTWPNEMTREGIRGLEYNKWSALPPAHYASLPFTRYLAGHGDFTVCTLRPDSMKGTRAGLQLAAAVVFTSPIMHWADTPSLYLRSPAIDLIRSIPPVWDETRVLTGSDIGKVAAFARRSGGIWFVGIINAGDGFRYKLDLDFLGPLDHDALLASDHPDRPDELLVTRGHFNRNETLTVELKSAGGFVGRFTERSASSSNAERLR